MDIYNKGVTYLDNRSVTIEQLYFPYNNFKNRLGSMITKLLHKTMSENFQKKIITVG